MRRPAWKYLCILVGETEPIGSREHIHHFSQCDAKTDQLQGVNSSLSERGNPFTTLAKGKACMKEFMSHRTPTRAHRKRGARSNAGHCIGWHTNADPLLRTNSSLSEVVSPFTLLAKAKTCMGMFMSRHRTHRAYRKPGAYS